MSAPSAVETGQVQKQTSITALLAFSGASVECRCVGTGAAGGSLSCRYCCWRRRRQCLFALGKLPLLQPLPRTSVASEMLHRSFGLLSLQC